LELAFLIMNLAQPVEAFSIDIPVVEAGDCQRLDVFLALADPELHRLARRLIE